MTLIVAYLCDLVSIASAIKLVPFISLTLLKVYWTLQGGHVMIVFILIWYTILGIYQEVIDLNLALLAFIPFGLRIGLIFYDRQIS